MRRILASAALLVPVSLSSCDNPLDFDFSWQLVSPEDAARVTSHLSGRVFRQSDPSRNAETRRSIVIDFNDGLSLRAQYTEGGTTVDDWRVWQDFYWMEKAHGEPVYRFDWRNPNVQRTLPKECEDCIDTSGLIVLVRDYFKKDEILFALWDSAGHMPSPFPVFEDWTRFVEDARDGSTDHGPTVLSPARAERRPDPD